MNGNDFNLRANKLISEWKIVIKESHPDSRQLKWAYAYMSIIMLEAFQFFTYEEAHKCSIKMEESSKRQDELYGQLEDDFGGFGPLRKSVHNRFDLKASGTKERKFLDSIPKDKVKFTPPKNSGEKLKYLCMNCKQGADKERGIKLSKCSVCKIVSYCSKECQKADWKNHKKACKLYVK